MPKKKNQKSEKPSTEASSKEAKKSTQPEQPKLNADELTLRYSFFKNQLEAALQELRNLELVKTDHMTAKATLMNMSKLDKETESMTPIGANTFLTTKIADNQHVLVDIGSKVVMKKTTSEAVSRLDSLVDELNTREKELTDNIQFSQKEMEKISYQLQVIEASSRK